jgi:hypothetical protein
MNSMKTPLLLLAPMMLFATGSALAGPVVTVDVPFAFTVRDQVMPAGHYRVERAEEDPAVLIIKGEHGNHAMVITSSVVAGGEDPAGEQSALVFTRDEHGGYRLKDVWEDRYDGQEITGR